MSNRKNEHDCLDCNRKVELSFKVHISNARRIFTMNAHLLVASYSLEETQECAIGSEVSNSTGCSGQQHKDEVFTEPLVMEYGIYI